MPPLLRTVDKRKPIILKTCSIVMNQVLLRRYVLQGETNLNLLFGLNFPEADFVVVSTGFDLDFGDVSCRTVLFTNSFYAAVVEGKRNVFVFRGFFPFVLVSKYMSYIHRIVIKHSI